MPSDWAEILRPVTGDAGFSELRRRVAEERRRREVAPRPADVMRAFWLSPWKATRVVVVGQDPYHGPGQANGLCFSVSPGSAIPPSLRNIFRELASDLGLAPPRHGGLEHWARQGVLLLNTALTVRLGEPNSHSAIGWLPFTDNVLRAISQRKRFCVFLLWGNSAQRKAALLDPRHQVLAAAHPSPLSARRGFFGSRIFSSCNRALRQQGLEPIDWSLATEPARLIDSATAPC